MNSVKDFIAFVQETAFPESRVKLELCKTPHDVAKWRHDLLRTLYSRKLVGQGNQEPYDYMNDSQVYESLWSLEA